MELEVLGGLFVGCLVSGVVPLINAELLVVGAAVLVPGAALPIVAAVSAVGQMASKTVLYGLARWAPARLPGKARSVLERASEGVRERDGAAATTVFASAALGLPPFYGVSLAAGALGVGSGVFVGWGLAGRALRFGVLAWGAHAAGAVVVGEAAAAAASALGLGG